MINGLPRQKPFSVLLLGSVLSKIGDGVHEFIFIITVLKVTRNGIADAGIIYFFRFIPYVVVGPIGGTLSDRLSRRSLMIGADLARLLVTCAFCAFLVTGEIGAVSLAVLGMLMTGFRTIFQPAFQATIPSILRPEDLPSANGAIQDVGEIGGMVGPALGGIVLRLISSPGHVIMLDAITYVVSAVCVAAVQIPSDHVAKEVDAQQLLLRRLYGEFRQNLIGVMGQSQLYVTIAYSSTCIFFVGGALRILVPAMMKSAGFLDSHVGYAMGLTSLGAIVGVVLCGRIACDYSTRRLMVCWCLYGLVLSLLPACVVNIVTILVGCFILGAVGAFVDVVLPTNIQGLSTNLNIGKNFSLFSTMANAGEALSGAFAGVLVLISSIGVSVTLIGLLTILVAYVGKLKSAGSV